MLIIGRKHNEKVIVSINGIEMQIQVLNPLQIKNSPRPNNNLANLGFSAPKEIIIYREEVWERIKAERGGNV